MTREALGADETTDPESAPARTRRLLAWLGAGLLAGGLPAHEVEEDVLEAAAALGYPDAEVGCFPTAIHLALRSGQPATFETVDGALRLDQLADVSAIHAQVVAGTLPPDAALARMATLRAQPHRYALAGLALGVVASAAGIALVLAPSWRSVVFAVLLAPVTVALMVLSRRSAVLRTVTPLVAGFVTAAVAFQAAREGLVPAPLWTLVAPIAVLLPGATLVTGLIELVAGALVAGASRLAHGTAQMLLFALGVGGAMALLRVYAAEIDTARPVELGWWAPLLGAVVVTVAIALIESLPPSLVPWLLATVLVTFVSQGAGERLLDARWAGAFVGAMMASLAATLVELVRPQVPRAVAFLPCFWLLVPGSLGLMSVSRVEVGPTDAALAVAEVTLVISAIALGVMVGAALARPLRQWPGLRPLRPGAAPRRGSRSPR